MARFVCSGPVNFSWRGRNFKGQAGREWRIDDSLVRQFTDDLGNRLPGLRWLHDDEESELAQRVTALEEGGVGGTPGPAGADGPEGPPGPAGPQGEEGLEGLSAYAVAVINGFAGTEPEWLASLVGAQGPAGADGVDGADGAAGAQGIQGPPGTDGADGAAGATGAQGIQGIQGVPGADGADGAPGAQGIQGPAGPQGEQGIQGIQGATGPAGANGALTVVTVAFGAYMVLTNIGAAYDTIGQAQGLGLAEIDFTGCTQIDLTVFVNKIGTGTQSWQVYNLTNSQEIMVIDDAAGTGQKYLTASKTTGLPTGVKRIRIRAKSTTAADDPVYYGGTLRISYA